MFSWQIWHITRVILFAKISQGLQQRDHAVEISLCLHIYQVPPGEGRLPPWRSRMARWCVIAMSTISCRERPCAARANHAFLNVKSSVAATGVSLHCGCNWCNHSSFSLAFAISRERPTVNREGHAFGLVDKPRTRAPGTVHNPV